MMNLQEDVFLLHLSPPSDLSSDGEDSDGGSPFVMNA